RGGSRQVSGGNFFLTDVARREVARASDVSQVRKGSILRAERMNCHMMATPQRRKRPSSTRAPVSPSPNRLASAQLPAKAARNTSAPIRIAALTTVIVFSQLIRRPDSVLLSMKSMDPVRNAGNLPETGAPIKSGFAP